jgi:hypothetical protein
MQLLGAALLVSPFFFWGTSMVAMKVGGSLGSAAVGFPGLVWTADAVLQHRQCLGMLVSDASAAAAAAAVAVAASWMQTLFRTLLHEWAVQESVPSSLLTPVCSWHIQKVVCMQQRHCQAQQRLADMLFAVLWRAVLCCALLQPVTAHTTPLMLGAMRLLPAGLALLGWAAATGRPQPKTAVAWAWVLAFALVDGAAFQVGT